MITDAIQHIRDVHRDIMADQITADERLARHVIALCDAIEGALVQVERELAQRPYAQCSCMRCAVIGGAF